MSNANTPKPVHRCAQYVPHAVWPTHYKTCTHCGKAHSLPNVQPK